MTVKFGQWSLLSLLIATAVLPLLIFTLAQPNRFFATIVVTIASLTWTAMGIVALIDTGERRAFAIGGFVAPATHALASLMFQSEFNVYERNWIFTALAEGFHTVFLNEFYPPDPTSFSLTVQSYDALMLVAIGGYFARWLYRHRREEEAPSLSLTRARQHDER